MSFVHLHVHTHYSLLDGIDSPTTIVNAADAAGHPAVAITDHGGLAGHRELYKAAKKKGIKPIFGVEAYISITDRFDRRTAKKRDDGSGIYNHIILLAKNQTGVENINKMNQVAWEEGFYHKPRIDTDLLIEHSEGVIVLTGCLSGIPAKLIEADRPEVAARWLSFLKDTFKDDLYVEIQAHNPDKINDGLIEIANDLNIEIVATSDCHRAYKKDKDLQDAFLILSTNPRQDKKQTYRSTDGLSLMDRLNLLYPDRRMTFQEWNLFIQTKDEIQQDFGSRWEERFATNTIEVANKIGEYEFHEGLELLPTSFDNPGLVIRSRCEAKIEELGLGKEYSDRLEEELNVIILKHFSPYFLIVEDMVNWAKKQGILVGPARGSAAGSLVCYLLGITAVDPIKHGLLFFRFINVDRNDFPDIDVDFQRSRRGEVKQYLKSKYGYVASISTYTYFTEKGVIKDAARVLGVSYGEVNKVMKGVGDFEDFITSKTKEIVEFRKKYPEVAKLANRLRGRIRGSGMHAGGVVVSKDPIYKYAPIETKPDPDGSGRISVIAYDMKDSEEIGLIKLDILGLNALDVISDTCDRVDVDYYDLPSIVDIDDPSLMKELGAGNTVGVFQCDTTPYTALLKEMKIESFNDFTASNALIRPGAMKTVGPDYIARAAGKQDITYVHESVREALTDTYGTIIYQEQVMQTAVELGGMSWSDADRLRKIIGKKKNPLEFAQYKDRFMTGATRKISAADANRLWHDFEAHAGYSFNHSHAVAYSLMSIWTLWLRENFPSDYMAALLKNESDKLKRTHYMISLEGMGITLKMPHINKSGESFEPDDNGSTIRFGLSDMKYVSDKVFARLEKVRPVESIEELEAAARQKYSGISTRTLEALTQTGALEPIGGPPTNPDALYEYLNVPSFNVPDIPDAPITLVEDYDEEGTFLIAAMVQKIKKGGHWSLIEVVDETGDTGFFDKRDTEVKKGKFYYFVIGGKNIINQISVDDLKEEMESDSPSALTRYVTSDIMLGERTRFVVGINKRLTKAKNRMADVLACDEDGKLYQYVVFSREYGKIIPRIQEGDAIDIKSVATRYGSRAIKDIRK